MNPSIVYEDQDIIVCTKPAGVPTQSSSVSTPDMVSILKNHIYKSSHKSSPYLAVIHRLDQPVEGLLVFAKTPAAAKNLSKQLTEHSFGKHYRALLTAVPDVHEADLIDYMVKDSKTNSSHICSANTPGAKKAVLHYKILETTGSYALVEITLETGRHHQIRVQMANLGTPIAGDCKYGSISVKQGSQSASDTCNASPAFHTLQLFAYRLTFRHPRSNKKMEFKRECPPL